MTTPTLQLNMNNVNQFKDIAKVMVEQTRYFSNNPRFANEPASPSVERMLQNNKAYDKLIQLKKYFQMFIDNPAASAQDQIDADSYMKMLNPILTKFEVYRASYPNRIIMGGRRHRRTKKHNKRHTKKNNKRRRFKTKRR